MFDGFAGQWTPVRFSDEVSEGRLVGLRVAGEKVVVFRDGGRAVALVDRCPHRGVELSRGRLTSDGCVECPFHGWRFDGSGACRRIPWGEVPDGRPERFAATSLPTREAGGMVWVHTSTGGEPPDEPQVPPALLDGDAATFRHAEEWTTHWTRAMENMLDSPHLPFVHRRTIGRMLRARARRGDRMEVEVLPRDHGFEVAWTIDGEPGGAGLEWWRPNGMALDLGFGDRLFRQHMWCVPVDDRTVRMMLTTVRGFGGRSRVVGMFDQFNRAILAEDRRVVESSDPPEVPPAGTEANVPTDRATLAFRRWYDENLRPQGATTDA